MRKKLFYNYVVLIFLFSGIELPTIWCQPTNDDCSTAIFIEESGMVEGSTLQAAVDVLAEECNSLRSNTKGVWYRFVGTGQMITFSTCLTETTFDTWISIYSGTCDALICEAQNDNRGDCTVNNASILDFMAEKGKFYYLLIGGVGANTVGDFKLSTFCPGGGSDCIQADECPDESRFLAAVCGCGKVDYSLDGQVPTILKKAPLTITNPVNDTTCLNGTAEFSINAFAGAEEATLAYQWQVANNVSFSGNSATIFTDISDDATYAGSTTNALNLKKVPHSLDELQYRVIVTQTLGNTNCIDTSGMATLHVFVPPIVSANPESSTICVEQGTTFSADASSSENGTLTYEWQVSSNEGTAFTNVSDNELYSQSTTKALKLDNVPFAFNQNLYRLILKEQIGAITCRDTSAVAKLTVNDNPKIDKTGQKINDICGVMLDLSGINTPNSEGSWSFVNASPEQSATLSDTNNITTLVTGVFGGQYTLRWTVNNGVCKERMDEITIDFNPDEDLPGGLPDGAQDCVDLCIGGDDRVNSDGVGVPDDCDCLPNDTINEFAYISNETFQLFIQEHLLLGLDTFVRKGDFELTSDAAIEPDGNNFPTIIFQAQQSITLMEGFHAKSGTDFIAELGFCRNPLAAARNNPTNSKVNTKVIISEEPIKRATSIETIQFEVFPTIVHEQAAIKLHLSEKNPITIELYHQDGRFIKTYLQNEQQQAGTYYFQLDASRLTAGMYFLRLVGAKEVLSRKIIVH